MRLRPYGIAPTLAEQNRFPHISQRHPIGVQRAVLPLKLRGAKKLLALAPSRTAKIGLRHSEFSKVLQRQLNTDMERMFAEDDIELGIEDNCRTLGEPCVAGIEMGERGKHVDDVERWVQESLDYLADTLPELEM